MKLTEEKLIENLKEGDVKAFENLFRRYYGYLCSYAFNLVDDHANAEEIVQEFFVRLWEKREQLSINTSVKNYFFRSIRNHCINAIQHDKIKARYAKKIIAETDYKFADEDSLVKWELSEKINESIQALPEKRREIFRLSREEGLKYREIAEKLNVSVKTVETQMSLAIKFLRDNLKKYSVFPIFF